MARQSITDLSVTKCEAILGITGSTFEIHGQFKVRIGKSQNVFILDVIWVRYGGARPLTNLSIITAL